MYANSFPKEIIKLKNLVKTCVYSPRIWNLLIERLKMILSFTCFLSFCGRQLARDLIQSQ